FRRWGLQDVGHRAPSLDRRLSTAVRRTRSHARLSTHHPEDLAYQATRLIPREKNARSQTVTLRHVEGACGVSPRPGNATSPRSMRSAPPNGGTEPRVPEIGTASCRGSEKRR